MSAINSSSVRAMPAAFPGIFCDHPKREKFFFFILNWVNQIAETVYCGSYDL